MRKIRRRRDRDDEFDNQEVDKLRKDVKKDRDDAKLAHDLAAEQLKQAKQANKFRESFFRIAVSLAGLTVLTSIGLVIATLSGAPIDSPVAVAFISGLAAQTVGILAVIAGYLFPRDRRGPNDQRDENR